MESSVFIAQVLAVVYAVLGLGLLLNPKAYQKVYKAMLKDPSLPFMPGVLALVLGAVLVLSHNYWVNSWEVIITIFGWIAFVKGAFLIIFPGSFKWFQGMVKQTMWITLGGVVCLGLAVLLGYYGFFA